MDDSAPDGFRAVERRRVAPAGEDGTDFGELVRPYRAELHAHCYRMLGSLHDADDALQETLLRAWRGLARLESRAALRSWLFRIATRVCLDGIAGRERRALPMDLGPSSEQAAIDDAPATEVSWLEPYPDAGPAGRHAPEARVERRESIELAFVAALQHLPGNERAALVLFDVLGFSADEVADTMATTRAAVNSALQRARRLSRAKVPDRSQQQALRRLGDDRLRTIVSQYADAFERADADALVALLAEDATWSMPPLRSWYAGPDAIADFLRRLPLRERWRHHPTTANGQPALGCYAWDDARGAYAARVLDVLTLDGDRISAVTAFMDPGLFARFDLPPTLPA